LPLKTARSLEKQRQTRVLKNFFHIFVKKY